MTNINRNILSCVLSTLKNLKSNKLQLHGLIYTQLQVKVHRKNVLKKVQLHKKNLVNYSNLSTSS